MAPIRATNLPDRYEVLGELGRGGMGIVYKARDRETGEVLAIKILKPEIAEDASILERFKNELRLAHQITHRNVARLYEFHRSADMVYLTMEFVEGESLRALLERSGKLDPPRALDFARQLADGLAEAHRQSIAHRDLKPENVMIAPDGSLKVMDFGISRSFAAGVTSTGAVIGTPAYMAPEQAEGKPVDHRTDIYAFGLILYEMFTGVQAFTGDTAVTLALKQVKERPKPPRSLDPTLPKHIESAVLRCLEKDPNARFQSIGDAMHALDGSPVARPSRAPRRFDRRWAIAAAAILVAAAGAWWWTGRTSDSVRLPLEAFTLPNGLAVAFSVDHSTPTVAIALGYRAGNRRDPQDRPGVAHLTEHVLFQGSANVGKGEHIALVSGVGGGANGQSSSDLDLFYENLPSNQLELGLFLEADRMRALQITPEGLAAARAAVLEERATGTSNAYARARLRLGILAFDNFRNQRSSHATPDEFQAITADDVSRFYQANYVPANAGLVVVGDFNAAKAHELVDKYFGPAPKRPAPPPPDLSEPPRSAEKREVAVDPGMQTPEVLIAWRVPGFTDPDWFPVKHLGEVLGANDAARLNAALVKQAGVASQAVVNLEASAGPNLLTAQVIVAPGKDPAQVEKLVYDEIDRIAREGITKEESERFRTDAQRRRAFSLVTSLARAASLAQSLAGYGRAEWINDWQSAEARVTSDDVRRMVGKYLGAANRTVLIVNPAAGGRP